MTLRGVGLAVWLLGVALAQTGCLEGLPYPVGLRNTEDAGAATCDRICPVGTCTAGRCPLDRIAELAVGGAHTCARLDDGSVRCWGNNGSGHA
jgi:hypothetical protein